MYSTIVLRNKDRNGNSTVYVQYSQSANEIKKIATGVKVAAKYFDKAGQKIKKGGTLDVDSDNKTIHTIKSNVDSIIRKHIEAKGVTPTVKYLEQEYAKLDDTQTEKSFFGYIDEFLQIMKEQRADKTYQAFSRMKFDVLNFQATDKSLMFTFDNINIVFMDKYTNYLISLKYNNTTIQRKLKNFKQFLNYYKAAEIHNNTKYNEHKFKAKKTTDEDVHTLTIAELQKLKDLDLSSNPKLTYIRDLFLIQSFTGLRYSDVVRLQKSNIRKGFINTDLVKGQEGSHKIPLLPIVDNILSKYGYNLRKISNTNYNLYIKELCGLLPELHTMETIIYYSGNKKETEKKERYKLMSTHTARRNYITALLEKGVNPAVIMKWTNHKNLDVFIRYINKRQGEAVEVEKLKDILI